MANQHKAKNRSEKKKVILAIIDGWGIAPPSEHNAIHNADTPYMDRLIRDYPNVSLKASGEAVGLPAGQFGTSEINHQVIGAGRIKEQDLTKINKIIETGKFNSNEALNELVDKLETQQAATGLPQKLHLVGILSNGGAHSHIDHLYALFDFLSFRKFTGKIVLHLASDGRDVAPRSAEKYFTELTERSEDYPDLDITIATIIGRQWLDRDRDWEKTAKTIATLTEGAGFKVSNWEKAIKHGYSKVSSDERLERYVLDENHTITGSDGVVVFHFRSDRIYQLCEQLTKSNPSLRLVSFCDPGLPDKRQLRVAFPNTPPENTLAEVISNSDLKQLHITETEKFAHLTYFLNGQRGEEFHDEKWVLLESNRFIKPNYDLEPSMRNYDISKYVIKEIENEDYDFIVINFSSPDMVGHTGKYHAAVVSAESVDYCIGEIYQAIQENNDNYSLIITADHGNSEIMWDEENRQPHTQHTHSKVPFILVDNSIKSLSRTGGLTSIAPTILELLNIPKPYEMTGKSLIER